MSFSSNYRGFISGNTGGSLFFYCLHKISIDNHGYTVYSKYCQTGGDVGMRYYKFVINGVENVKSFKNSDSSPGVGVFQYGEHKIKISECSYKEKYCIWRRGKNKYTDVISRFVKEKRNG